MAGALQQHRIEAALMVEPLITAGSADVQTFGDAMGAIAPHFITTGWFAGDAWLQANPDVAARFVRAMLRVAVWANAHHAESAQILVRSAKLDPAIAAKMTRSTYGTSLDPALMQRCWTCSSTSACWRNRCPPPILPGKPRRPIRSGASAARASAGRRRGSSCRRARSAAPAFARGRLRPRTFVGDRPTRA